MTIPRQIGPETGPRRVLPDFSRSTATVERMIRALQEPANEVDGADRRLVRALLPADGVRDIIVRCVIAAVVLGAATVMTAVDVVLVLGLERGRSPVPAMLLVLLCLGAAAVVLALVGLRYLLVAATTARARVEITEAGPRVVGLLTSRFVPWHEIHAVESRVVHPVHWLTAALRLKDGSRVIMPVFDRHLWAYTRPSGQDLRALRTELQRQERLRRPGIG